MKKINLFAKLFFNFTIILGLCSVPCRAEWILFNNKSDDFQTYLDYESASRDGDIIKISKLANMKSAASPPSAILVMLIDCKKKRTAGGLITFFSQPFGRGNVLLKSEDPPTWSTPKTGDENDIMLKLACAKIK
jgi:hypothetical protein